ncbi:MAG: diguanylate cyclase [Coleofasciculaceae cyanobacterium SM2_3_26]|nr:diguanylate cyclase [Coleofasciculaceae cyanobacterium SM2_3_26]
MPAIHWRKAVQWRCAVPVFLARPTRRDRTKCQDSASLFAVLFLDLDGFKFVNDALGHLHGDRLLIATAQRLRNHLGSQHIIARFGGDEFTILLKNIADAEEAVQIAQSLNHSFQNPFNLDGYQIFTNVSIGIAVGTIGHTQPEDLLQAADVAMYRAKEKGRGGYEVFDVSMKDRVLERLQLENDLRWGIERQEFQVYYQPIVMLETNRVVGFEALVRWQHPHRGWIPPSTFIPIAEETGLIVPLGWWILNAACKQLQVWHQQFSYLQPLTLSVNLSFRQFLHADLTAQIQHTLQETGVDPSTLKLEITESAVMQNPQSAIAP